MATALIVIVILIFFSIILLSKCEIHIISRGRLIIELSFTVFKIKLWNFKSKKPRKKISIFALRRSLGFLLCHSAVSFNKTAITEEASSVTVGASRALFSIIFAYVAYLSDKINLPNDVEPSTYPFELDVSVKTRLCFLPLAFLIYKIKARSKSGGKA